jgi:hypothetical protein
LAPVPALSSVSRFTSSDNSSPVGFAKERLLRRARTLIEPPFLVSSTSALATATKQLWLLYIGYGIIGGAGLGIAYISPVSPLQKWFPDWCVGSLCCAAIRII